MMKECKPGQLGVILLPIIYYYVGEVGRRGQQQFSVGSRKFRSGAQAQTGLRLTTPMTSSVTATVTRACEAMLVREESMSRGGLRCPPWTSLAELRGCVAPGSDQSWARWDALSAQFTCAATRIPSRRREHSVMR